MTNQIDLRPAEKTIQVNFVDNRCCKCEYWHKGLGHTGVCQESTNNGWVTDQDQFCLYFKTKQ